MRYVAQSLSWLLFVLLAAGQAAAQDPNRRKEAFAGGIGHSSLDTGF